MAKYIIPSKEKPIFVIYDNDYGPINIGMYKDFSVPGFGTGFTSALSYSEAVNTLHDLIREGFLNDKETKGAYTIYQIDGRINVKDVDIKRTKVYSINLDKARKVKLI